MSITYLSTPSSYIVYSRQTLTYFHLFSLHRDYVKVYHVFRPIVQEEQDQRKQVRSRTGKLIQELICKIGETETSSPAISCADSTAIADRYKKIAGLIIPPKALKKGRHASHMCKQGVIWQEFIELISTQKQKKRGDKYKHDHCVCQPRLSWR